MTLNLMYPPNYMWPHYGACPGCGRCLYCGGGNDYPWHFHWTVNTTATVPMLTMTKETK